MSDSVITCEELSCLVRSLCKQLPDAAVTDELATYEATIIALPGSVVDDYRTAIELLGMKVHLDLERGLFTRYVRWHGVDSPGVLWARAEEANHGAVAVVTSQYTMVGHLVTFAVYGTK